MAQRNAGNTALPEISQDAAIALCMSSCLQLILAVVVIGALVYLRDSLFGPPLLSVGAALIVARCAKTDRSALIGVLALAVVLLPSYGIQWWMLSQ